MKLRSAISLVVLFLVLGVFPVFAQDWQNRNVVHISVPVEGRWYIPFWSLTNFREKTGRNTNLLSGVGYRENNWWLEGMLQHQWNQTKGQWMLDMRYDRQYKNWHTYSEIAVFLNRKALYEFVVAERRTFRGFWLGVETENLHQPGPDAAQLGFRGSRRLGRFLGFDVSFAPALRFSLIRGHTEPRVYLIFNRWLGK